MRSRLDQIESRLQAFIESSLHFLPGDRRQDALARQLVNAIERAAVQETGGNYISPNLFKVRLHPTSLSIWTSHPGLAEALVRVLIDSAREAGVYFFSPPILQLQADPALPLGAFEIETSTRENAVEQTAVFLLSEEKPSQETRPIHAFLILNGATIPLTQAVVNIGRRQDNQVVVDDPRVSRTHAQLRAVKNHYVLFDLNSTGGTFVNSVRITRQQVHPGDVISLAGVAMIYGEENHTNPRNSNVLQTGRLDVSQDPPSPKT